MEVTVVASIETMSSFLQEFVTDFATGIEVADAKRPQAASHRTKKLYQPGIGPHTEAQTVDLVADEMFAARPDLYAEIRTSVPYSDLPRQKCDLAVKTRSRETWFIEVKMMRLLGDNGKPNDNILTHILSPYKQHRSALTDCEKLLSSGFDGHKAISIYGYTYPEWPIEFAINAFEALAKTSVKLGQRHSESFGGLCHPVHTEGSVMAWEIVG